MRELPFFPRFDSHVETRSPGHGGESDGICSDVLAHRCPEEFRSDVLGSVHDSCATFLDSWDSFFSGIDII